MLLTDLTGQTALVTGATGGVGDIGHATCISLAKAKCTTIAVHYNSATEAADKLVEELTELGVRAHAFRADLSSYDEVRRLHASMLEVLGAPTILFANAGLTLGKSGVKSAADVSIEDFEQTRRANCGAAYLLTQLCLPSMEERGFGRVIFTSSVAGFTGGVVGPHYASSKSALHGLVHWLSLAYCAKGITVNAVAPALIEGTSMLPGHGEELAKKIPLGRLGRTDEIAETVLWMIKTGYVTNKVITVDGGMVAQ